MVILPDDRLIRTDDAPRQRDQRAQSVAAAGGDGLMRVAAKAFHFQIAGVDGIAQRGRRLRRSLKAKHALVPSIAGEPVGLLAGFCRPLCRRPDGRAVNCIA